MAPPEIMKMNTKLYQTATKEEGYYLFIGNKGIARMKDPGFTLLKIFKIGVLVPKGNLTRRELGSGPIFNSVIFPITLFQTLGEHHMSNLFWLIRSQLKRMKRHFPLSHGIPRSDDLRGVSGIIHVIKRGLQWRDAPALTRRCITGL